MSNPAPYIFTVEFSVDPSWIEDGFDLSPERALIMLEKELPYAYRHELGATIVKPPFQRLAKLPEPSDYKVPENITYDELIDLVYELKTALSHADQNSQTPPVTGQRQVQEAPHADSQSSD